MIISVVRQNHWQPTDIGRLFLDDEDYNGLVFWYNDAKELEEKAKKP